MIIVTQTHIRVKGQLNFSKNMLTLSTQIQHFTQY